MLGSSMETAAVRFVKSIKETEVYKRYYFQLQKLKEEPELYAEVNEYRKRNFELQNTSQVDELFDKMYAFEREYEKFRENPLVDEFLTAELAFCRMMQELDIYITKELNFE
ncbi:MAG: YlbF family regulator [Lachnospiraceae bacterium]|nr:YlbF family regulator [Lachnospiraceae bacterium]